MPLKEMKTYHDNLYDDETHCDILHYLTGTDEGCRHLSLETLQKFKVGIGKFNFYDDIEQQYISQDAVIFPMFAPLSENAALRKEKQQEKELDGLSAKLSEDLLELYALEQGGIPMELVKSKVRSTQNKRNQVTYPSRIEQQALFGLPTVNEDEKTLVITEGEFDAMAVHQMTNFPTVSLP